MLQLNWSKIRKTSRKGHNMPWLNVKALRRSQKKACVGGRTLQLVLIVEQNTRILGYQTSRLLILGYQDKRILGYQDTRQTSQKFPVLAQSPDLPDLYWASCKSSWNFQAVTLTGYLASQNFRQKGQPDIWLAK